MTHSTAPDPAKAQPPPPSQTINKINPLFRNTRAFLAVAGIVVLAVWAATIQAVHSERQNRLAHGDARTQELARIFESHAQNVIGYADTYIKATRREYLNSGGVQDVQEFLRDVPLDSRIVSHVTIIDAAGQAVLASTGILLNPATLATDRDYFTFQKSTPDDQLYISKAQRGRNSGALTIRVARRIEQVPGQFGGVIFAAISIEKLIEPFQLLESGPKTLIGLIGEDREIRAWSESGQSDPNRDIRDLPLWPLLAAQPTGVVSEISPVDGVLRSIAYRKLADYPLIAAFGISSDDMILETAGFTWSAFSIAALVTLIIVLLTSSILRDVRLLRTLEQEVSVRRRAEAEAIHATEIKTAFLATMSHEVRTPINAIMGLFELIERADIPARQKRQASAGRTAAGDLFKQLTNVLDASRLEAKSLELTLRDEPVRPMINDLTQLLEAAVLNAGKPIKSATTIAPEVPEAVRMDRRRVEQIVLNLIDNAIKFTENGRVDLDVSIDSTQAAPMLRIDVVDTGPGISEMDQARIFDRFAQLDSMITRRAGGTGLGLSICSDLAKLMKAQLEIKSTVGRGTHFSLLMPIE